MGESHEISTPPPPTPPFLTTICAVESVNYVLKKKNIW